VGQGEFPPGYIQGSATNAAPGSCQSSTVNGVQLPYCHNLNVNVHNNSITTNSSSGDELFSATPAGAGGVSFCTGSDFYKFNYNWVCGNLSTGDGGGVGHMGFSYNGDIEHNWIVFNQSSNPTIPANGGGLLIMGAPDADPTCGATTDQDCVPAPGSITPSDGTGPNLVINANLIMGNSADSGSGGGVMFQQVNGTDVVAFGTTPSRWNSVNFTNNIVANNIAGWDGAGIALLDSLNVNIVNNTIMSNDTTASSGVLFNTLGAPLASTQGSNCTNAASTASCPQPAGLVSIQNSAVLSANLPTSVTCPAGHFTGASASNGTCRSYSVPLLYNDVFYQNRFFDITVGALGAGTLNQQHVVSLVPTLNQVTTGQCVTGANNYWDLGVRGDTGPTNHTTITLAPTYSIVGSGGYAGTGDSTADPTVVHQYCNGSRIPPEYATVCTPGTGCSAAGYQVPPGISDATVPNPIFNLTPAATVDEGNNWINLAWGPLSLTNPTVVGADGNFGGGAVLGNYAPLAGSPVTDSGTNTQSNVLAPTTDFFGNARPQGAGYDKGAVELAGAAATFTATVTTSLTFTNVTSGTNSAFQNLTLTNTGSGTLTGITRTLSSTARFGLGTGATTDCGTTLAAGQSCTIRVRFQPNTAGRLVIGSLIVAAPGATVTGSPVALSGTSPRAFTLAASTTYPRSGNSTLTVNNTTAAGVAVTSVAVPLGGSLTTWFFSKGTDGCSGTNVAAGGTCTVNVSYTVMSATPASNLGTHSVAVTFTDGGAGSPQTLTLSGTAN
jgi:hypothetical protein